MAVPIDLGYGMPKVTCVQLRLDIAKLAVAFCASSFEAGKGVGIRKF